MISSASTPAYDGRLADFFQGQLPDAQRRIQNGDISPSRMTGSWASHGAAFVKGGAGPHYGLKQVDRRPILEPLTSPGYDTQGPNSILDAMTGAANRTLEVVRGLPVTGIATPSVKQRLG